VGRDELVYAGLNKAWPLLSRAAELHRRTLGRRATIVTVVGSHGKTTTARVLAALLGISHEPPRDNCLSHLAGAVLLHAWGRRREVLEVAIDLPGQMASYGRMINPDVVVVTSIGSPHHRSLGSLEATRREKAEMVARLRPRGVAVLNGDDGNVLRMREIAPRTVTFGFGPTCDVRATEVELDWPHGMRAMLHVAGGRCKVRIGVLGTPMVRAALGAIAAAVELGVTLDEVAGRLPSVTGPPARLQLVPLANGACLLRDEFNSPQESIHAALDVLASIPARRRLAVLGEVSEPRGSQGPVYRAIGEKLASTVSLAVILGGSFQPYASGVRRAATGGIELFNARRSVQRAAAVLRERLAPGDVVLIKGRDTQRLDRVALALMGQDVRCDIPVCFFLKTRCAACALLGRSDAQRLTRFAFPFRGYPAARTNTA
jgi:UDP-N-acetylmuramoyl-tripeptide--D-alanyl-D-alanine ligase